jgi:hypothetical protein
VRAVLCLTRWEAGWAGLGWLRAKVGFRWVLGWAGRFSLAFEINLNGSIQINFHKIFQTNQTKFELTSSNEIQKTPNYFTLTF